jgi:hypothetical protein
LLAFLLWSAISLAPAAFSQAPAGGGLPPATPSSTTNPYSYSQPASTTLTNAPTGAGAGINLSSALADGAQDVTQFIQTNGTAGQAGSDDWLTHYNEWTSNNGGGPLLAALGIPVGTLLSDTTLVLLLRLTMVVMIAFTFTNMLAHVKQQAAGGMDAIARYLMQIFVGALIAFNPGLLYATAMTLSDVGNTLFSDLQSNATAAAKMKNLIGNSGTGVMQLSQVRQYAITKAINARAGLLLKATSDSSFSAQQRASTASYFANFFNALAAGQGATGIKIPDVTTAAVDTVTKDTYLAYSQLTNQASLNSAPASISMASSFTYSDGNGGTLSASIPSSSFSSLYTVLNGATGTLASQINALPNNSTTSTQLTDLMSQYSQAVQDQATWYIDNHYFSPLYTANPQTNSWMATDSPSWYDVAGQVENAMSNWLATFFTSVCSGINKFIAGKFGIGLVFLYRSIIELNCMLLPAAFALSLSPKGGKAFTGLIHAIFAAALVYPVYEFLMYFTDLVFGAIGTILAQGTIAAASVAAVGSAGELLPSAALSTAGVSAAYFLFDALAYFIIAVILAVKTPKIIRAFLSHGGGAATWLGTVGAGLIGAGLAGVGVGVGAVALGAGAAAAGGTAATTAAGTGAGGTAAAGGSKAAVAGAGTAAAGGSVAAAGSSAAASVGTGTTAGTATAASSSTPWGGSRLVRAATDAFMPVKRGADGAIPKLTRAQALGSVSKTTIRAAASTASRAAKAEEAAATNL